MASHRVKGSELGIIASLPLKRAKLFLSLSSKEAGHTFRKIASDLPSSKSESISYSHLILGVETYSHRILVFLKFLSSNPQGGKEGDLKVLHLGESLCVNKDEL